MSRLIYIGYCESVYRQGSVYCFVRREPEKLKGVFVCVCACCACVLAVLAVLKHVVCMNLSLFTVLSAGSDNVVLLGD